MAVNEGNLQPLCEVAATGYRVTSCNRWVARMPGSRLQHWDYQDGHCYMIEIPVPIAVVNDSDYIT